jgi:hypothetical protein
VSVTVSIDGLPEAKRRLEGLTGRQMQAKLKRAVRAGAKPMQASLKAAAASQPNGHLPHTFKRVPAAKVSASMRRGGEIVASVKPKSALWNIFEPGAEEHEIEAGIRGRNSARASRPSGTVGGLNFNVTFAGVPVLAGRGGKRWRKRGFFARGKVKHPGMSSRSIRRVAFAAGKPAAQLAIARVLLEAD